MEEHKIEHKMEDQRSFEQKTRNKSFKYVNLNNVQDIIKLLEKNNASKFYSLKKYDMDRIITILKKQNEEHIMMAKKIEKSRKIGKAFSDRFNLFNVLWTNLKKSFDIDLLQTPNGGLCGSFIRQFFELPYALENEFSEVGYGNPIGHDLDIIIFKNIADANKTVLYECFYETMKKYQDHINFSLINPDLVKPIEISDKVLIQVCDATIRSRNIKQNDPIGKTNLLDIPHYIFKFKDKFDNSIIEIDVVAHKPNNLIEWVNVDFNVNSLILNDYGIHSNDSSRQTSFIQIINCIRKKEAQCYIDFFELGLKAQEYGLLRYEKVKYLMQIAWTMRNRFKLLNVGYKNIVGSNIVDYSINTTEECFITSCKPPYFDITLKCNHKLSLMAFIGILEETDSQYSQSIRCPLCRDDLQINYVTKECSELETYQLKSLSDILENKLTDCKLEDKEEVKFLSEESDDYIKSLIHKNVSNVSSNSSRSYNDLPQLEPPDDNYPRIRNIGRRRGNWDNS
jgi:hypothetical protein